MAAFPTLPSLYKQRRCCHASSKPITTMAPCRRLLATLIPVVAALAAAMLLMRPPSVAGERHVAAADGHMCMIEAGGVAACYGSAAAAGKLNPPANATFHAVTVGDDFSCGLTAANSSLRCWGTLPGGALPPPNLFFLDAHAGPRHVCGLLPNGTVLCYGDASSRGAINVPPGVAFQSVTAGANYTCGVARNHSVVCWGDNSNPVVAASATWRAITDAEHVAAGADHACYVRVNGSVACWGSNARDAAAPPPELSSNGSVWWLAAGAGMTCAISGWSVPGPVTCWGTVNGTVAAAGYEVACAGWGCVASTANATGNGSGRVAIAAAVGGLPLPQRVGGGDRAVVVTLAGNGTASYSYADSVGAAARFYYPAGVSLDGSGGLYVADSYNHVIRRVAGIAGTSGATVDPTPLQSTFFQPYGVEVDGAGNIYVADMKNNAIRMLSGVWVAGNTNGTSGSENATDGTDATFYWPNAVRADVAGGLLYVADTYNYQVRTIAINDSYPVTTLATLPSFVYDIALDAMSGVMYVAVGHSVYVVTYDGVSSLLAGNATNYGYVDGTTGSTARFYSVCGLALDTSAEVLYATDYNNNRIRRITTTGGAVATIAGSGASARVDGVGAAAAFYGPIGIALDAAIGALYVSDYNSNTIRLVQFPIPAPLTLVSAPLPPSPLARHHYPLPTPPVSTPPFARCCWAT